MKIFDIGMLQHHTCVRYSPILANVPTMHHHQDLCSGEAPPEDSTPFANEQYFGSSVPDTQCGEAPQHVDKSCHPHDPTSTTDSLDESSTLDAPMSI